MNRHPAYFIGDISANYPLSVQQLLVHKEVLFWKQLPDHLFFYGGVSSNESLDWNLDLLDTFKHDWDWFHISFGILGKCFWQDNVLDLYEDVVSWEALSSNEYIPWSVTLLEKYSHHLDWTYISNNRGIYWTEEMLETFEERIDFKCLGNSRNTPWGKGKELVLQIQDETLPITKSIALIEKYEDKLDWDTLFFDWKKGLSKEGAEEIVNEFLSRISV